MLKIDGNVKVLKDHKGKIFTCFAKTGGFDTYLTDVEV